MSTLKPQTLSRLSLVVAQNFDDQAIVQKLAVPVVLMFETIATVVGAAVALAHHEETEAEE